MKNIAKKSNIHVLHVNPKKMILLVLKAVNKTQLNVFGTKKRANFNVINTDPNILDEYLKKQIKF